MTSTSRFRPFPWPTALVVVVALLRPVRGEDWPMYRHDRLRTAVTAESLPLPLKNVWLFRSRLSWKAPPKQTSTTDRGTPNAMFNGRHTWAAQPTPAESRWTLPITAAGDAIFFTGHDGRIVCLAAETGAVRWQHLTGAAVTRAANHVAGRVYAGSDDGHAYCLDARDGGLIWRYRAAPADRWLISYGRFSSTWPVRTDVLVDEGVAYFTAGIFPHDGLYVHAIQADDATPVWQRGGVPHGNFGISGYPILTRDKYHTPVDLKDFNRWPMFRRSDGVYDWAGPDPERQAAQVHFSGGDGREAAELGVFRDGIQYTGGWAKDTRDGKTVWAATSAPGRWFDPGKAIIAGETLFYLADDKEIWGADYPLRGQGGAVIARSLATGEQLWSFDIPERPHDVIVANGRLFVSTRNGTIYAFAGPAAPAHGVVNEPLEPDPYGVPADAAAAILAGAGVGAGFAVVLGCEDGATAYQLAARAPGLDVVAVFADEARARAARERYARADLHGSRIVACVVAAGGRLPVPSRTIDLVTAETPLAGGWLDEAVRVLKPIRGTAFFRVPNATAAPAGWTDLVAERAARGETWESAGRDGGWTLRHVRPAVPDGGGWAGPRGGIGNTNSSHDKALVGPLGVVWYGGPSVRTSTDVPPIMVDGVMFCPVSEHEVQATDLYNGRPLWSHRDAGIGAAVFRSATAGGRHVYVLHGEQLIRFGLYDGDGPTTIPPPIAGGAWATAAVSPDGATLWGVARRQDEQKQTVWSAVFAIETATGRVLWTLGGPAELERGPAAGAAATRQWGGWAAIADGRLYFLGAADEARRRQALEETRGYLAGAFPDQLEAFDKTVAANQRDLRTLTAVDALTGRHLYDHGIDATDSGSFAAHAGQVIGMATMGVDRRRKNPLGGPPSQGLAVWDGATGRLVWKRPGMHAFTPVITGTTIFAEPWAYDLRTGERTGRVHPLTGAAADFCWARTGKHCGGYTGSEYFLFGRNMGVGYYDTRRDAGLYTFWHSRVACASDVGSGGGMMIKPPYSLGCKCAWSLPFTFAMGPSEREPEITFNMMQHGEPLPVKHARLNFGADGDLRDGQGHLWIKPDRRPAGYAQHVELPYAVTITRYPSIGNEFYAFVRRSLGFTPIDGTELDAVFASGDRGARKIVVPLSVPGAPTHDYTLRLGFVGLPTDRPGQRVFEIRVNGRMVEPRFDALEAAGGPDRAVWRDFPVSGTHEAVIEFLTPAAEPGLEAAPILSAAEVIRR